jgi:hypothetical protein
MIMAVRPPRWPKLAQDYEWPWRRLVIPVARWLGLSGLSALRSHQPPAIKANVVARSRGPPGAGSAYTAPSRRALAPLRPGPAGARPRLARAVIVTLPPPCRLPSRAVVARWPGLSMATPPPTSARPSRVPPSSDRSPAAMPSSRAAVARWPSLVARRRPLRSARRARIEAWPRARLAYLTPSRAGRAYLRPQRSAQGADRAMVARSPGQVAGRRRRALAAPSSGIGGAWPRRRPWSSCRRFVAGSPSRRRRARWPGRSVVSSPPNHATVVMRPPRRAAAVRRSPAVTSSLVEP